MTNKELTKYIKYNEMLLPEMCQEIIQRLLEFDELKKLIEEVINPIIELCKYSAKIPNFQEGDINYGREK